MFFSCSIRDNYAHFVLVLKKGCNIQSIVTMPILLYGMAAPLGL